MMEGFNKKVGQVYRLHKTLNRTQNNEFSLHLGKSNCKNSDMKLLKMMVNQQEINRH